MCEQRDNRYKQKKDRDSQGTLSVMVLGWGLHLACIQFVVGAVAVQKPLTLISPTSLWMLFCRPGLPTFHQMMLTLKTWIFQFRPMSSHSSYYSVNTKNRSLNSEEETFNNLFQLPLRFPELELLLCCTSFSLPGEGLPDLKWLLRLTSPLHIAVGLLKIEGFWFWLELSRTDPE